MAKKKSPKAAKPKRNQNPNQNPNPKPVTKANASKSKAKKAGKPLRKKKSAPALGRPKVTGEEQLFMLFHEDFHSRQIFDFLRVHTVKELEQYSPQQIVKLLSKPITDTVNRIRRKLAEKNRHLQDDIDFAIEFQAQAKE
jgi:hypothetical protein